MPKIKFDSLWEKRLMPEFLIRKKHNKKLNKNIETILESKNPDPAEIGKIILTIKKMEKNKTIDWYKYALKALDDRISQGEGDKPLIREKLNKKILDLSKES